MDIPKFTIRHHPSRVQVELGGRVYTLTYARQVTDAGAGTQVVGDYVLHEKLGQGGAWEPYHLFLGPQMVVMDLGREMGPRLFLGKSWEI